MNKMQAELCNWILPPQVSSNPRTFIFAQHFMFMMFQWVEMTSWPQNGDTLNFCDSLKINLSLPQFIPITVYAFLF